MSGDVLRAVDVEVAAGQPYFTDSVLRPHHSSRPTVAAQADDLQEELAVKNHRRATGARLIVAAKGRIRALPAMPLYQGRQMRRRHPDLIGQQAHGRDDVGR